MALNLYIEPDTFSLNEFVKQRGATELELQIVKTYFDLNPDTREMLVEHFRKGLADSAAVEKRWLKNCKMIFLQKIPTLPLLLTFPA